MSAQWDDLPEALREAMLHPLDHKVFMGREPDQTLLEGADLWAEEREAQAEVDRLKAEMDTLATRIMASLAGPTGASDMPPGLPTVAHGEVLATHGADPTPPPTPARAAHHPVVAQSENRSQVDHGPDENGSQPTPVQRRDAWLQLHGDLVRVTENQLRWYRGLLGRALTERGQVKPLANEWAALQLLKALRDMKAPEVPEDDTLNQPTLAEALEPEPEQVHWMAEGGRMLHPYGPRFAYSGDEEEVTCHQCLLTLARAEVPEERRGKDAGTGIRAMLNAVENWRCQGCGDGPDVPHGDGVCT